MKYLSTRGKSPAMSFSQAIRQGLASDGGLYVPESFPQIGQELLKSSPKSPRFLTQVAQEIAKVFLKGDPLEKFAAQICKEALDFPIFLKKLDKTTAVLELFHGPTSAFKDVGARFLAGCLSRSVEKGHKDVVLVATSGDTGGAVAAAFYKKPSIDVVVLFPEGRISARQQQQLCCWGANVLSVCVEGSFDDCQALVKEAFMNENARTQFRLTSANSINIGRILPQTFYYAWAALEYSRLNGREPGFIVPTGNLGNAMAALWAKKMGFPMGKVVFACNANHAVVDYVRTGVWKPQSTIATLANAMDVGNASNVERLQNLYPDFTQLQKDVEAYSVSDSQIRKVIEEGEKSWKQIWCPHTACAVETLGRVSKSGLDRKVSDWILVSTAHPAKFEAIVEPLVGHTVDVPQALEALFSKKQKFVKIKSLAQLMEAIKVHSKSQSPK